MEGQRIKYVYILDTGRAYAYYRTALAEWNSQFDYDGDETSRAKNEKDPEDVKIQEFNVDTRAVPEEMVNMK